MSNFGEIGHVVLKEISFRFRLCIFAILFSSPLEKNSFIVTNLNSMLCAMFG